jgi:glycosyltransferase involved in cell wall biosynthesis
MNLNENRRVPSPEYIDVQSGWDYLLKVGRSVWEGCSVHTRVNAEAKKGYLLALAALLLARLGRRPALLTYGGGHQQTYFPAPRGTLRHLAFSFLFRFHYVEFTPVALPQEVEDFFRQNQGVFFCYVCFRKEFTLDFLAEAIRRFRVSFPKIGFLLVGPWEREMKPMKDFLRAERLDEAVCLLSAVPHDTFLTLLSRSLAYIRTPVTDGICSSVLESLKLKVPVLAADNGTRPPGAELWQAGNVESLLALMTQAVQNRVELVARIPEVVVEDNAKKLADSIEEVHPDLSTPTQLHTTGQV